MAKRLGRPPKGLEMTNTAFRLPKDLIDRIDKHLERMGPELPGRVLTRSDAVRVLLLQALEVAEQTEKPKARGRS